MPTPGPLELVIILVIALLVLGPGKLPEVGASLGKSIREFRKASSDIQETVSIAPLPAPVAAAPVAAAVPVTPVTPVTPVIIVDPAPSEPVAGATAPSADSTKVAN